MSSLTRIASSTLLIPWIYPGRVHDPFVLVDVGSRGGFEKHWRQLEPNLRVVGFDASQEECEKLNEEEGSKDVKHYPYALGAENSVRDFHVYSNAASSSFFMPNLDRVARFSDKVALEVRSSHALNLESFDSVADKEDLQGFDFLKLDVEGFELEILKGASSALQRDFLGVQIEYSFIDLRVDEPSFSDVSGFLASHGFELYDLSTVRLGRDGFYEKTGPQTHGQVVGGHALFLREWKQSGFDGTSTLNELGLARCLKLAIIMELYGLPDCASELLKGLAEAGLLELECAEELALRLKRKYRSETSIKRNAIRRARKTLGEIASLVRTFL